MQALQPYMTPFVAGLVILTGLTLAVLVYRMLNRRMRSEKGARLGVSEVFDIDNDRRLLLVRRDDVEHLVLIGGEHDLVIEQNIETGLMSSGRGVPSMPMPHNVQPLPVRPAPRPPVFGGGRPTLRSVEPVGRDDAGLEQPAFAPRDQN